MVTTCLQRRNVRPAPNPVLWSFAAAIVMFFALSCCLQWLGFVPKYLKSTDLELLTTTASQIQSRLSSYSITSVELCRLCLSQIKKQDYYLNAVVALNPNLLKQAEALDEERRNGRVRGPLLGIPA